MQEKEENKVTACKSVFKNADKTDLKKALTEKWTELISFQERLQKGNSQK
ncbi:MAG: hypothetical protein NC203_08890 [Firmicutes bacterium]|nr:hypothetical protein [Bacillota bacterium]